MWLSHYSFHFLGSYETVIPAMQRFVGDLGWHILGEPAWGLACCRPVAEWLPRLEIVSLDLGLLLSLYTGYRIALSQTPGRSRAIKTFLPWAALIVLLFAVGVWIVLQPMQMRGTISGWVTGEREDAAVQDRYSALGWLLVGACGEAARGDGGTVRLSRCEGGYRITVFTAPTPFRAGPVDISVLVQDAATGELDSRCSRRQSASLLVTAWPADTPCRDKRGGNEQALAGGRLRVTRAGSLGD